MSERPTTNYPNPVVPERGPRKVPSWPAVIRMTLRKLLRAGSTTTGDAMNGARLFRKKPVEIEAWQWLGGAEEASPIIDWLLDNGATARWHEYLPAEEFDDGKGHPADPEHMEIDTLEGTMRADIRDFIIRGVKGEFYPCKPDIFQATYEPDEADYAGWCEGCGELVTIDEAKSDIDGVLLCAECYADAPLAEDVDA